jgi:hypothetical protein
VGADKNKDFVLRFKTIIGFIKEQQPLPLDKK